MAKSHPLHLGNYQRYTIKRKNDTGIRQSFIIDAKEIIATKKTLKVVSITVEKTISETGETQAQILKWLKNNPGDVHD